jgi:hypothetical protein
MYLLTPHFTPFAVARPNLIAGIDRWEVIATDIRHKRTALKQKLASLERIQKAFQTALTALESVK